jgi:predicted nucleic acid-binding protein
MKQTIYLDTSVPSAYFDERNKERQEQTREFWKKLKDFTVFISPLVLAEIERFKDAEKRRLLLDLLKDTEQLIPTGESEALSEEYVGKGIIPVKYKDDARHIAVAVVNSMDYLVSWNFEHIVKVKTRRMVGLVDIEKGYKPIEIVAPPEL